jgi:hypothetical protein
MAAEIKLDETAMNARLSGLSAWLGALTSINAPSPHWGALNI